MILNKYLPPILQIAITLLGAYVLIPETQFGWDDVVQLGILGAGAGIAFLVPVVDGKWAGALKTGLTIVAALLGGILSSIIAGGVTPVHISLVVIGGLNALATEIGVQVRQDQKLIDARDTNVITTLVEDHEIANNG